MPLLQRRASQRFVSEINVVPYIDVMLVLLVIFIVTAPLLQQGISVDLPDAQAKSLDPQDEEPIVLSVDRYGHAYLNIADAPELPLDKERLLLRLQAALRRSPARKVLVKGDAGVSYGQVVAVMTWAQQAGAPSVGLVTHALEPLTSTEGA